MKEQLHKHKTQEQLLTNARHKEEKLSQEVNLLKEELLEATKGHTPVSIYVQIHLCTTNQVCVDNVASYMHQTWYCLIVWITMKVVVLAVSALKDNHTHTHAHTQCYKSIGIYKIQL